MRIINIHKWDSGSGGAGRYYLNHEKILTFNGHDVIPWASGHTGNRLETKSKIFFAPPSRDFQQFIQLSTKEKAHIALSTVWNKEASQKLDIAINHFKPDAIHFHNIYHQLSASVLDTANASGIPVVQSLHDFSHFCIQSHFFRDGKPCFDCVESGVFHGIRHKCFNDNLAGSILTTLARWLALQKNVLSKVAGFTTPCEEIKTLLVKLGLPRERILVIDNPFIVADFPFQFNQPTFDSLDYIAAWGTFAEMKGFGTLIDALELMSNKVVLKLFAKDIHAASSALKEKVERMQLQGRLEIVDDLRYGEELFNELALARLLVVPSEWLVTQEYTVWEGMLLGRPVVVGDRGGNQLLVENRDLIFKAGNAIDLAMTLDRLWAQPNEYLNIIGAQLQQLAITKSNTQIYAKKMENFYNEIR